MSQNSLRADGPVGTRADRFGPMLLDRFTRLRIINLEHRVDRRREITAQLARIGLEVDGERIAFHAASRFDEPHGFRTPGARGCFHSHLNLLTEAAAQGVDSLLVLEDDVDFSRTIEQIGVEALADLANRDWSIFYGAYLDWTGQPARKAQDGGNTAAMGEGAPLTLAAPESALLASHFIGWRRDAITAVVPYLRAMLERPAGSPEGGPMDVDGAYGWFRRAHPEYQTWVAEPQLGHQRPSQTDVHPLGRLDSNPLTRPLMGLARRVKRRVMPRD